jgi:folate-binding protein YgfZ
VSAPAVTVSDATTGYARLRRGAPTVVRGRAALIWVEGPDAGGFLQGLLSNDITALDRGGACAALILDAKGHIQTEARVHRGGDDTYTLLTRPELGGLVAEILHRFHFSEDLEIIGPEEVDRLTVAGGAAIPGPEGQVVVPGLLPGTVDLVVDEPRAAIALLAIDEAPPEALELARIAAGVPLVGVDTGPLTLVQEVGLDDGAVSFEKGCYLGQETVARVAFRGRVNRRLRGLALAAPAPVGAVLTSEGREVGTLTSVGVTADLGAIGLAVIRHEVEPGGRVDVEGGDAPARVVALPFPPG